MFIHEMSRSECNDALLHAKFGRLACTRRNQPYILPHNLAFDGDSYLYGFTTLGQKVEWMRSNPLVCFEIDEVKSQNLWSSVIVFGQYEELPDIPEFEVARSQAHAFLQQRALWWEPAYISDEHRDRPHSLAPIFFRIRIDNITGHRANTDDSEAAIAVVDARARSLPRQRFQTHVLNWTRIVKAAVIRCKLLVCTLTGKRSP